MTRSYRNNNPGNLNYGPLAAKWGGALEDGDSARFAKFPTAALGVGCLAELLTKPKYSNSTLEKAMLSYAPQSENDTEKYIQFLTGKVGVPRTTILKDLDALQFLDLMRAITIYEGYKP
jgi:hypothetical protein